MRILVKKFTEEFAEFLVVSPGEWTNLVKGAGRGGYDLKIVSNPYEDLPLVVQST